VLRPFLIALQFLTRLPIRLREEPDAREVGRSVLWYPLVGLLIGMLLAGLAALMAPRMPHLLGAALLLTAWVLVTGALHLDGLADSADAWIGGAGDRHKTLAIMKDPYCGPAAVVILVTVLLVKFAALAALVAAGNWKGILLAPLLGRTALPLLFLTTPYVRPGGLGAAMSAHLPRKAAGITVLAVAASIVIATGGKGVWMVMVGFGTFLLLRQLTMRRIGGTTGDTAGALVELVETAIVVLGAICAS